jgi:hypothetical protein
VFVFKFVFVFIFWLVGDRGDFVLVALQVVDPRGMKKDGDELLYGEEVMLVDDQGMVWNNCMVLFTCPFNLSFCTSNYVCVTSSRLLHNFLATTLPPIQ